MWSRSGSEHFRSLSGDLPAQPGLRTTNLEWNLCKLRFLGKVNITHLKQKGEIQLTKVPKQFMSRGRRPDWSPPLPSTAWEASPQSTISGPWSHTDSSTEPSSSILAQSLRLHSPHAPPTDLHTSRELSSIASSHLPLLLSLLGTNHTGDALEASPRLQDRLCWNSQQWQSKTHERNTPQGPASGSSAEKRTAR